MSKTNRNFCKPNEDGTSISYGPIVIPPKLTTPTEEEYNAIGYYRNGIEPPNPPEGKVVSSVHYSIQDNIVVAEYEYEDAPIPVRTFSKLRLEDELFKRGLLDKLDAFINSQEVENEFGQKMPLRRKYDTALTFNDDHPLFKQFVEVAKQVLKIDDDTAEEILNNSLAD